MSHIKFAPNDDDKEAERRAEQYAEVDPFPSIPMALLSSVEIQDYARVTSMLHPFYPKSLKSASYEAHAGGEFIYWEESGEKRRKQIQRGSFLTLPANSISFVQVEPTFRLPNYMALRFNLRITHVHRGLLLGTGPLIDPGFHGKLLIPLHNLTSDPYKIDTKKALIWIEFTKTTYAFHNPEIDLSNDKETLYPCRDKLFRGFPPSKKNKNPHYYFEKANGGNPIRSSIPGIIIDTKEKAERAEDSAKDAANSNKLIRNIGIGAGVVVMGSLAGIVFQTLSLISDTTSLVRSVDKQSEDSARAISTISTKLEEIENRIKIIATRRREDFAAHKENLKAIEANRDDEITTLKKELSSLKEKLQSLSATIPAQSNEKKNK